jgi:predicted TIM-barrel fold metal-dependent hydrolase
MEEPENPDHALDAMRWIGFDRVLFSTDYPHWDFDDPAVAIPHSLGEEQRRMIFAGNARKVYRLD